MSRLNESRFNLKVFYDLKNNFKQTIVDLTLKNVFIFNLVNLMNGYIHFYFSEY